MLKALLASCVQPPPGINNPVPCNDVVGPALLRPFLAVMLAIAIVAVAVWLARRGRPKLEPRRRMAMFVMAFAAACSIVAALWLATHEFYYPDAGTSCSSFSSRRTDQTCYREAWFTGRAAFVGAAVVVAGLVQVARGPRSRTRRRKSY